MNEPQSAAVQASEERFRHLVEAVEDYAIYMLDPEGHVTTWNKGAERNKGYTSSEIIGRHFSCFFLPEDVKADVPRRALEEAVKTGHFATEGWRVRKDGSVFWVSVVINPILGEQDELLGFAKVTRDLTERRQSEERFRHLVEAVEDYAIYMLDPEGYVTTWNKGAERNKGYTSSEIIGRHFSCFFQPGDAAAGIPQHALREAVKTGHFATEGWRVRKDGSVFWVSVIINPIRSERGELLGFAKVTRDLTERRANEELLRKSEEALQSERDRLRVMIQSIGDCVIATDNAGCVDLINLAAESATGLALQAVRGNPVETLLRLVDAETGAELENPLRECLSNGRSSRLQQGAALLLPDGTKRDIQLSASPICSQDGEVTGAVLTFQDVTQMRAVQRETEFSANHDALTRLPNRRSFERELAKALDQATHHGLHSAICVMDLDRFKNVNDTAGHLAGDSLLRIVSDLITRNVRSTDLVARLGGDEFAIIFAGSTINNARGTLERIRLDIEGLKFSWENYVFAISTSIGVTAITGGKDALNLVHEADIACYAAKSAGRNQVHCYSSASDHDRRQALSAVAQAV